MVSCGAEKSDESKSVASNSQITEESEEQVELTDSLDTGIINTMEDLEDTIEIEAYEPTELSRQFSHPIDACLQSNKVESLIIPPGKDDDEYAEFASIPQEAFDEFNKEEKLIYCLKYPEWFDQVCAESMPYDPNRLKIELPWDDSGRSMSTRQDDFISDNAKYVLSTLSSCIGDNDDIPESYLRIFNWLHYTDYIPQLLNKYKSSRNTYYLTLCIEMMKTDEYNPYYEWAKNTPLNEPEFEVYMTGIELTDEIEASLLELIGSYYKSTDRTNSPV